jgi:CRP/FNR family transcriptional regulator, cyclic AMP receptor protein
MDPHHQVVDLLARAQLFKALDERVLRQLAARLPQRVFAKGAAIFVQEELGDRMFVLAEGVVKLVLRSSRGNLIELVRHRPPAVFGEVAVLDGGPRSATAEAVQRSKLIVRWVISWGTAPRFAGREPRKPDIPSYRQY